MRIVHTTLGNVFAADEPVRFGIDGCAAAAEWTVRDYRGDVVATGALAARATELTLPVARVGYFDIAIGTGTGEAARTTFAVVARRAGAWHPDPRFGVCSHFGQWWDPEIVPLMAAAGVGEARDEMYWDGLEKEKGVFVFPPKADACLRRLAECGIGLHLGLTYGNPFYDGGQAPYTQDGFDAYARYANAVLDRFAGRIRTVEIWNEWNAGFGGGPAAARPEIYHGLLSTAYRAIKRAHPDVTVVGGSVTGLWWGGYFWLRRFLALPGALELMDALSVHPYKCELEPEYLTESMAKLNAMMRDAGGPVRPLWTTEIGWPINVHPQAVADQAYESLDVRTSEEAQARYLVRSCVLMLAAGVERIHWYDFMNDGTDSRNGEHNFGLIRHPDDALGRCVPMPAFSAYAAMTRELSGSAYVRREPTSARLHSHVFRRGDGEVRAVWSLEPALARVRSHGPVRIVDLVGDARAVEPRDGLAAVPLRAGEPVYLAGPVDAVVDGLAVSLTDHVASCVGEQARIPYRIESALAEPLPVEFAMAGVAHRVDAPAAATCDGSFVLPAAAAPSAPIVPCTVRVDGVRLAERPVRIDARAPLDIPHPPMFVDGSTLRVPLRNASAVRSLTVERIRGEGADASVERSLGLTLAPGEQAEVDLAGVRVEPYAAVPFALEVTLAGAGVTSWRGTVEDNPVHRLTPTLDGRFEKWERLSAIDLARHGTVRMQREYRGSTDLAGTVWLAYDERTFYVAARIVDDVHVPPVTENGGGDLIDVVVAPYTPWDGAAQRVWPGEGFTRFTLSLRAGGPQVFQWKGYTEDEGQSLAAGAVCRAERRGTETLYEAAVPRAGRLMFAPGSPFFSCSLLVNDPDGLGARGWIEWGSGFAEGKRRNLFRLCRLEGIDAHDAH